MRILLLGKHGQLGWELHRSLPGLGEITALDYPEIDLAQPAGLGGLIERLHPQVIVNATAYTAVDQAESRPELAYAINRDAAAEMASAARRTGAVLVHYSTDYVFDGTLGRAYSESDPVNPLNIYGRSKLEGEEALAQSGCVYLTFRTAWVYSLRRPSFVSKVLEWSRKQTSLRVVDDQVSSPTWARSLAAVTAQMLAKANPDPQAYFTPLAGLYHLAGEGAASRLAWARLILELDPHKEEQKTVELLPAATSEFPTPAQRPLYSPLDCAKFNQTFGLRLPDWQTALKLAMNE